jgi:hypothetical protein
MSEALLAKVLVGLLATSATALVLALVRAIDRGTTHDLGSISVRARVRLRHDLVAGGDVVASNESEASVLGIRQALEAARRAE